MKAITAGGAMQPAALPTTKGHINLFEDLKHNVIAAAIKVAKKTAGGETENGCIRSLLYTLCLLNHSNRKRDEFRKSALTSITKQLASRSPSSSSSYRSRPALPGTCPRTYPEEEARDGGGKTPSTAHRGSGSGYGNVFNRKEVEEAHRERDGGGRRRHNERNGQRAW
ncbi:hypothetical protein K443DRAFT_223892 [Laccaria amethystina LaAM-08-1]|uniref:Uncharacterized protein n=1 Tax=Laccaria amethystina LaAM-08-1 TaxID=1095629 RepID=A0A0C9WMA9_9AGAR|nr:hypothetical protein K443DRAFT_223892 [Laccaria amethystina LaAM-08-1]